MTQPLAYQTPGTTKIRSGPTDVTGVRHGSLTYEPEVGQLFELIVHLPSPEDATSADEADYLRRTEKLLRVEHTELLQLLSEEFGMSWTTVSNVVGVSIPAIRKWRTGGDISEPNRLTLSKLAALCEQLHELAIEWPASWLERRVWPATPLTFVDVAARDRMDLVLAYAAGSIDGVELLNAFEPDWRERYRGERTEVTFDDSGRPTLHVGPDDVS